MKTTLKSLLLRPLTVYILLALAILLPLLGRGYILTLDMVFTPHFTVPHYSDPHFLFLSVLHVLNFLLPSDIIQKLLLLTIFVAAGMGMHYLMARLHSIRIDSHSWKWACYFAGILYVCNPFVYSRFMSGQYLVLLAYALLPVVGSLTLRLVASQQKKDIPLLGIALGGVGLSSLHMLLPAFILLVVLLSYGLGRAAADSAALRRSTLYALLALATALLINFSWLMPLIRGHGETATTISSFTTGDTVAFQTSHEPLGLIGNVLALQGFWGDVQNIYDTPDTIFTAWFAPIILLWLLILGGIVWSWRNQRLAMFIFLLLGFLGMVSAIGTSGTIFAPINAWLTAHVPFATGYREPQKFVALIVLAYAYFGGIGIAILRQRKYFNSSYIIMSFPFLLTPLLLFGGMRQLRTVDYPIDWYVINTELSKVAKNEKTLFLPWHLYMPYGFTQRVIANPAPKFFTVPIIASSNPELGGASPSLQDETGKKVDQLLKHASQNDNLAHDLARLDIAYIIVSKDFDYKTYDYLQRKNGINLYKQMETLTVYRISER